MYDRGPYILRLCYIYICIYLHDQIRFTLNVKYLTELNSFMGNMRLFFLAAHFFSACLRFNGQKHNEQSR